MANRGTAPFKVGDIVRRLPAPGSWSGPNLYKITFVNPKAGVFSAESADGKWSGWGGPFPKNYFEVVQASTNAHPETEPK